MYRAVITAALAVTPTLLAAQVSANASATAQANASTRATNVNSNASVEAEVAVARERGLPTHPIRRRAAEGRAKGATETQIALAARRVRMNLETAHEILVSAGRSKPEPQETENGATALERGYTRAQLEAVVKSAPSDRSLVVAFDVLTRLVARGVANENALAQVRSRLEARATDAQINALVSTNANANAALGAGRASGNAAAGVNAGAGAAVGATKGAVGVAGGVTGTVGGVLKKP